MPRRYFHKRILLLLMSVMVVCWCFSIGHAESKDEFLETATNLVVMIEGKLNGEPTFGAGIIFNSDKDSVSIVTANHVMRRGNHEMKNIQVTLKSYPDKVISAKLIEQFDSKLDLAVLKIFGIDEYQIDRNKIDLRVLDQTVVERNDAVFPVGNPNGVPWGMPVVPDRVSQVVGKGIIFQSAFIGPGHSGGALIGEGGVLVGMIVQDQPPFGRAVSINHIKLALKKWKFATEWQYTITHDLTDGLWKVLGEDRIGRFGSRMVLKTEGKRVFGYINVEHTDVRMGGAYGELLGTIIGNTLRFEVEGQWVGPLGLQNFSFVLRGRAQEDHIDFQFQFLYPQDNRLPNGEFTTELVPGSREKVKSLKKERLINSWKFLQFRNDFQNFN